MKNYSLISLFDSLINPLYSPNSTSLNTTANLNTTTSPNSISPDVNTLNTDVPLRCQIDTGIYQPFTWWLSSSIQELSRDIPPSKTDFSYTRPPAYMSVSSQSCILTNVNSGSLNPQVKAKYYSNIIQMILNLLNYIHYNQKIDDQSQIISNSNILLILPDECICQWSLQMNQYCTFKTSRDECNILNDLNRAQELISKLLPDIIVLPYSSLAKLGLNCIGHQTKMIIWGFDIFTTESINYLRYIEPCIVQFILNSFIEKKAYEFSSLIFLSSPEWLNNCHSASSIPILPSNFSYTSMDTNYSAPFKYVWPSLLYFKQKLYELHIKTIVNSFLVLICPFHYHKGYHNNLGILESNEPFPTKFNFCTEYCLKLFQCNSTSSDSLTLHRCLNRCNNHLICHTKIHLPTLEYHNSIHSNSNGSVHSDNYNKAHQATYCDYVCNKLMSCGHHCTLECGKAMCRCNHRVIKVNECSHYELYYGTLEMEKGNENLGTKTKENQLSFDVYTGEFNTDTGYLPLSFKVNFSNPPDVIHLIPDTNKASADVVDSSVFYYKNMKHYYENYCTEGCISCKIQLINYCSICFKYTQQSCCDINENLMRFEGTTMTITYHKLLDTLNSKPVICNSCLNNQAELMHTEKVNLFIEEERKAEANKEENIKAIYNQSKLSKRKVFVKGQTVLLTNLLEYYRYPSQSILHTHTQYPWITLECLVSYFNTANNKMLTGVIVDKFIDILDTEEIQYIIKMPSLVSIVPENNTEYSYIAVADMGLDLYNYALESATPRHLLLQSNDNNISDLSNKVIDKTKDNVTDKVHLLEEIVDLKLRKLTSKSKKIENLTQAILKLKIQQKIRRQNPLVYKCPLQTTVSSAKSNKFDLLSMLLNEARIKEKSKNTFSFYKKLDALTR